MLKAIGLSKNKDPYIAGKEAVHLAYKNIKPLSTKNVKEISIAFVFATAQLSRESLLKGIKEELPNTPVVGCSGAGIISPSGIDLNAVAVLLVSSEKIKFACAQEINLDKKDPRLAGQTLAKNTLRKLGPYPREAFIIFMDGLIKNPSRFISGIKEMLGTSLPIIGGASADDLKFEKTYQFFDNKISSNCAVGVLIGESAVVKFGIRHGWKPLGKSRIVTESSGNLIKTIENKPATSMYDEYFGKDSKKIEAEKIIYLSVRYPLGIYVEGEKEYLLRNAVGVEKDGSIVCQGDVPQGASIKLMMGTKESVLQAAQEAAGALKKSIGIYNKPVEFALVFDSFSRNRLLGRAAKNEVEAIKTSLGEDMPFLGFYTYGEQAPLSALNYRGQSHFHNESVAIIGIGEQ
ncbi:MAG: hypothetical protein COV72_05665 [Candidatus Omnitrophica bacterium CG11_big_fil_rev_8_21_14_0_20_42_13]|uniref:FIST domain-containing protein n=1 Tax=Candidatus Ghiorseimicrobium undicola TaxID=1974746 RepID=A0A2H0LX09_9BACT|nr:MAG: hypothetical protein COV72_05665 [Candidatus Omnitrophica bacterium CG11_big_fil_rev_8_21_14_0_20_42_13]